MRPALARHPWPAHRVGRPGGGSVAGPLVCGEIRPLQRCIYRCILSECASPWDSRKSEANLAERGFDFEFATLIFERPTLERLDGRRDYGESRVLAVGVAQAST
jgi:hypothetical protein